MRELAAAGAQRGQATVEHVGLAVVVALLLALVAVWLAREVRPPASPPRFVDAAAQPLESAESWAGRSVDPLLGLQPWRQPRGRDGEPIGRALRAGASAGAIWARGVVAQGRGGLQRLQQHLADIRRNPLRVVLENLRGAYWLSAHPQEAARQTAAALRDYVVELGRLGPEGAYLRLAHDSGREAVDLALARGQTELRRLILGRVVRGPPPEGDPPAPPGGP
jgi:hypothetical protein